MVSSQISSKIFEQLSKAEPGNFEIIFLYMII